MVEARRSLRCEIILLRFWTVTGASSSTSAPWLKLVVCHAFRIAAGDLDLEIVTE